MPVELVVPGSTSSSSSSPSSPASSASSAAERNLVSVTTSGRDSHQPEQRREQEQGGQQQRPELRDGAAVDVVEGGDRRKAAAWKNFPKDMIAGALLGGVAHTVVAPVERAKLLLQTQDSNMIVRDGRYPRYKGLVDCIVRVARDEGVLSLWRGNGSSVMRYYPSLAINFAFKVNNYPKQTNTPVQRQASVLPACTQQTNQIPSTIFTQVSLLELPFCYSVISC